MNSNYSVNFGMLLVTILLFLYAATAAYMVYEILQHGNEKIEFNKGVIYVVTTVGALVSALVVANLALTEPNEDPSVIRMIAVNSRPQGESVTRLVRAYLVVWLLVGLAALVVGVMIHPEANQTVSDLGTAWLGIVVASAYAYFGIKPTEAR